MRCRCGEETNSPNDEYCEECHYFICEAIDFQEFEREHKKKIANENDEVPILAIPTDYESDTVEIKTTMPKVWFE